MFSVLSEGESCLCLVSIQDVADIAEWEDEQIEYIKEKITEEGRQEDLKKGKPLEQVFSIAIHHLRLLTLRCAIHSWKVQQLVQAWILS